MWKNRFSIFTTILLINICSATYAGAPFSFALLTDIHIKATQNNETYDLNKTVKKINNQPEIKFVLVNGDITQNGNIDELAIAKKELDSLKVPYYVTLGNHDVYSDSSIFAANFRMIFKDTKYSFTYNDICFIGIATAPAIKFQKGRINDADFKWLKYELMDIPDSATVFLSTHYPLLPGDVENDTTITSLLSKHDVDFVLNGHYHRNAIFNYNGIPGIVSRSVQRINDGTSGYSIFKIENNTLEVTEKRIDGTENEWLTLPLKLEE